jgi:hypothetical protein
MPVRYYVVHFVSRVCSWNGRNRFRSWVKSRFPRFFSPTSVGARGSIYRHFAERLRAFLGHGGAVHDGQVGRRTSVLLDRSVSPGRLGEYIPAAGREWLHHALSFSLLPARG